ncbi:MAG: DUF2974 domain-containing protein [Oscillospiraceae bacterium]|nr:DUF2974 domain-containing protein [Oscillospiraceae bacterium]
MPPVTLPAKHNPKTSKTPVPAPVKMDGIVDYVRWLGRFSFSELPLCEADVFVMCVIAYYDLKPVLRDHGTEGLRLRDCREQFLSGEVTIQITGGDMGNGAIFQAATESARFGELLITDYSDIFEPTIPLQFMALTLHYRNEFSFIAYRGTDETIAGWKEDCMLSFTVTEAQRMAEEYARQVIRPEGRYYMAGHSKGGNQVLFAACLLPPEAWERVEHVYILDGPGFCPEVLDQALIQRVDPKCTRIIPQFDVVGKLFEPKITDTRIVRSSAKGILQHSLATWGIEYGGLALAKWNDQRSQAISEILNRWIESVEQDSRKALIDDLFDALAAGGAVTLSDIASGPQSFEAVLARMYHASPDTKKAMKELSSQAWAVLFRHWQDPPPTKT